MGLQVCGSSSFVVEEMCVQVFSCAYGRICRCLDVCVCMRGYVRCSLTKTISSAESEREARADEAIASSALYDPINMSIGY